MGLEESRGSYRNDLPQDLNDLTEEELLPTLSLIHVPHPAIPNLYQRCFEYVERWQWSWETERVETGHWVFAPEPDGRAGPSLRSG